MLRRVWRVSFCGSKQRRFAPRRHRIIKKCPHSGHNRLNIYITALGRYSPLTVAFCFTISMISRSFSVSAE